MRLHVNLIPALAYALVMMFSHLTGITGTTAMPLRENRVVVMPASGSALNNAGNSVFVTRNGQVILSNGTKKSGLQWMIPYQPENSFVLL